MKSFFIIALASIAGSSAFATPQTYVCNHMISYINGQQHELPGVAYQLQSEMDTFSHYSYSISDKARVSAHLVNASSKSAEFLEVYKGSINGLAIEFKIDNGRARFPVPNGSPKSEVTLSIGTNSTLQTGSCQLAQ
jgi:hypothetical protein